MDGRRSRIGAWLNQLGHAHRMGFTNFPAPSCQTDVCRNDPLADAVLGGWSMQQWAPQSCGWLRYMAGPSPSHARPEACVAG